MKTSTPKLAELREPVVKSNVSPDGMTRVVPDESVTAEVTVQVFEEKEPLIGGLVHPLAFRTIVLDAKDVGIATSRRAKANTNRPTTARAGRRLWYDADSGITLSYCRRLTYMSSEAQIHGSESEIHFLRKKVNCLRKWRARALAQSHLSL